MRELENKRARNDGQFSVAELPLLMTASVDPKGMSGLSVADVAVRRRQYLATFEHYLRLPSVHTVVFAENSGCDLSDFSRMAACFPDKIIELLSCSLNDYPRHLGKSYGELRLMDYAVEHSKYLQKSAGFIKVTGRFRFLNLEGLLNEAQQRLPWVMFCDIKDHPIYDWLRNGWNGHSADTRFFIVRKDFYRERFYGQHGMLNDSAGELIEMLFFRVIKRHSGPGRIISRFRTEPEPAGQAGHQQISIIGTNDYSGTVARNKRRIRQIGRWLVPWFRF
jgi:hypothetical protein